MATKRDAQRKELQEELNYLLKFGEDPKWYNECIENVTKIAERQNGRQLRKNILLCFLFVLAFFAMCFKFEVLEIYGNPLTVVAMVLFTVALYYAGKTAAILIGNNADLRKTEATKSQDRIIGQKIQKRIVNILDELDELDELDGLDELEEHSD